MNGWSFTNGRILATGTIMTDARLEVDADGRIAAIGAADRSAAIDLEGGWIVPGYIDTQVNGGGGVLFNDSPSVEAIAAIGAAHAPFGTTAFLPTLISDTLEVIEQALDAVDAAIEAGVPGVIGIHVEGPFLSPQRPGIHDPRQIRPLDDASLAVLTRPRLGKVMVTLAPEQTDPSVIVALVAAGVIVSIGHSNADHATADRALKAGARGFTHLFNAMSPLGHRAPGVVGAALDDRQAYVGLIADGIHVDPVALRIALRAKGPDHVMLVTDAMPSVGEGGGAFTLHGVPIEVVDGMCRAQDGTLAGSDLDMASAVRNLVAMTGTSVPEAAHMASGVPAAFLGLGDERGRLAAGLRGDWLWLLPDLSVARRWIGGRPQ